MKKSCRLISYFTAFAVLLCSLGFGGAAMAANSAAVTLDSQSSSYCNVLKGQNFESEETGQVSKAASWFDAARGDLTIQNAKAAYLGSQIVDSAGNKYMEVTMSPGGPVAGNQNDGGSGIAMKFSSVTEASALIVSYKICFTSINNTDATSSDPATLICNSITKASGYEFDYFKFIDAGSDGLMLEYGSSYNNHDGTDVSLSLNEWYNITQYINSSSVTFVVTKSDGAAVLNTKISKSGLAPLKSYTIGARGTNKVGNSTWLIDDFYIMEQKVNIPSVADVYEHDVISFDADIPEGYTALTVSYKGTEVYSGGAAIGKGTKHSITIPDAGTAAADNEIKIKATYPQSVSIETTAKINVKERIRCETVKETISLRCGSDALANSAQIEAGDVVKAELSIRNTHTQPKQLVYVLTRRADGRLADISVHTAALAAAGDSSGRDADSFTLALGAAREAGGRVYLMVFDSYEHSIPLGEFIEIK